MESKTALNDHFNKEWLRYLAEVYGENYEFDLEQKKQLFMAFHAGGLACFRQMVEISHTGEPDTIRQARLNSFRDEIFKACSSFCEIAEKRN